MSGAREMLSGFAVDLGGTKIAAARIEAGTIVARSRADTDGAAPPEAQVAAMRDLLLPLGYTSGEPLGIAVAGRIDAQGCWHAVNRGTLSRVSGVALHDLVSRLIGPCRCLNDGAAAVLAEARHGAGRGANNLAFVTVSTGVGGGLMVGGRLLESASGLAGHVGFTTSRFADSECGSGRVGTVESIAGGRAIAAAAALAGHATDARGVCEADVRGEVWAGAILDRSANAVAALVTDLTVILGLERVVIGGSIGLEKSYKRRIINALDAEPDLFRVPVKPAAFGGDAPLIGALACASDESV
jgi:predicted NBD/HSP70 family sugar kinase